MITKNTKASPVQVNKLKEELCEWKCLNCESEYYGPSAVEKGSFKCLRSECQGRYCVPKKYLANATEPNDTDVVAAITNIATMKKAG